MRTVLFCVDWKTENSALESVDILVAFSQKPTDALSVPGFVMIGTPVYPYCRAATRWILMNIILGIRK